MPIIGPIIGLLGRALPWIAGLVGYKAGETFGDTGPATTGIFGFSTKDVLIIGAIVVLIIWINKKD